jgi:hypothetical protein
VKLLEETTLPTWNSFNAAGEMSAVDETEWVNQIRLAEANGYMRQESVHPNFWGQLALRNCLRQVYNNGAPKGGTCVRAGNGLKNGTKSYQGEPYMKLQ